MTLRKWCAVFALGVGLVAAEGVAAPSISVEAQSDYRERGLSWSRGRPALMVAASIPVVDRVIVDIDAATLRGSDRHGGSDAALTVSPRFALQSAGWDVSLGMRGRAFIGRSGMNYVEATGDVARTIGTARIGAGVAYAPSQGAIGGSNLYLDASAAVGVPGTPLTVYGGLGRSSGTSNDVRSARLRPGGNYTDHRIGVEHSRGRLTAGLRYSGTSIDASEVDATLPFRDGHFGSRVVGYLRLTL